MPRAPQSSALLAASPAANRRVLSSRMPAVRSMPLSRLSGTRLTSGTGSKRLPSVCQTKASAASKSAVRTARRAKAVECIGDPFEKWPYRLGVVHLQVRMRYLSGIACLIAAVRDANGKRSRLCEVAKGPPDTIVRPEFDGRSPEANGLGAGVLIPIAPRGFRSSNVYDTRVRADCRAARWTRSAAF